MSRHEGPTKALAFYILHNHSGLRNGDRNRVLLHLETFVLGSLCDRGHSLAHLYAKNLYQVGSDETQVNEHDFRFRALAIITFVACVAGAIYLNAHPAHPRGDAGADWLEAAAVISFLVAFFDWD